MVNNYADTVSTWSTTMPTSCLHSKWLCRHHFRVVNDYFSICPRSQRLHDTVSAFSTTTRTRNFRKYQIKFVVTFIIIFFTFSNVKYSSLQSDFIMLATNGDIQAINAGSPNLHTKVFTVQKVDREKI